MYGNRIATLPKLLELSRGFMGEVVECGVIVLAKWLNEQTGYIFKSAYFLNLSFLDDIEIYHLAKNNKTKVVHCGWLSKENFTFGPAVF